MRILAHRGQWSDPAEQNSLAAIERAFASGYGVETDVRDHRGRLVIAHDLPDANAPEFDHLLELHWRYGGRLPLALNVKADGLSRVLSENYAGALSSESCFFFDMSTPEIRRYDACGLTWFTRESEIEPEPVLLDRAHGVWMDCFDDDWIEPVDVEKHLSASRCVAIVSPELHGRNPWAFWTRFVGSRVARSEDLLACTDFPDKLKSMFEDL